MSKTRFRWWSYVKSMIRYYPELDREYRSLHEQKVTAKMTGMPRGGGAGRQTESIAIRELPYTEQREYEAVKKAIETTARLKTGADRLCLVDLVFWKQTHTLQGAAFKIHSSYRTAVRYHSDFILLVAKNYGLLDRSVPAEKNGIKEP